MADTLHTGKKWWLLIHGHVLCILGFFLVVVLPVVFTFFFTRISVSFAGVCLIIAILFVFFVMIVSGYAYRNLHAAVDRLPHRWVLEDFDPVRYTITVKNEAQIYTVLYHVIMSPYTYWLYLKNSIVYRWEMPPEHYQVWTPLDSVYSARNRYDYLDYVRPRGFWRLFSELKSSSQGDTVFDEELMQRVPHLHGIARNISSFRFAGLARENGETVVVVFLTQKAGEEVIQALDLLKEITRDVERYHPSGDNWD